MSGIDEILPYALENFPPKNYDTYEEWLEAVSEDFENNGRLPLEDILQEEKHIRKQLEET